MQNSIRISKSEYARLKKIQKYFEKFWAYFEHLQDIKKSRDDIKARRVTSQKKLFKDLGI